MKRRIRLTESDLHRIINRSVKRILNEVKLDNPHNNLGYVDDMVSNHKDIYSKGARIEECLAELMVDNGLTIEDVEQYDNLMSIIDRNRLNDAIEEYKSFLQKQEAYDKKQEYEAWAEDQMSDMGLDYE